MKKKILICLLCVFGLFCGLTCFAGGGELTPGLQNDNYVAPEGYTLGDIYDFVDGYVLTIPAGTTITSTSDVLLETPDSWYIISLTPDSNNNNELYFSVYESYSEEVTSNTSIEIDDSDAKSIYYITFNSDLIVDYENSDLWPYIASDSVGCYFNFGYTIYEPPIAIAIVEGASEIVGSVGGLFVSGFTACVAVFYNNGLTLPGYLLLIGLAITMFLFGLRFIRGLINKARAR